MYSLIAKNKRNTVFIMLLFVVIVGLIGFAANAIWGDMRNPTIPIVVGVCAIVFAIIQYYAAGPLALSMSGAREISKADNPNLWRVIENLAITSGMPMPKVYIIDDPAPNAMAIGRDPEHASVGVTTGLLEITTKPELEGVIAHELSHVRNYDSRVSLIVFGLVVFIGVASDILLRMTWYTRGGGSRDRGSGPAQLILMIAGLVALLVAPLLATLVQAAISRQREYLADASAAELTRYPEGLASALQKIGELNRPMQRVNTAAAHLWLNEPLPKGGATQRMLSTHPPLQDRIDRLRFMGSNF